MKPEFTTPCYVRIDDAQQRKEVCDILKKIGKIQHCRRSDGIHSVKLYDEDLNNAYVVSDTVMGIFRIAPTREYLPHKYCGYYDCGTNIPLFLDLAAMRRDSDYMQWFVSEEMFTQGNELFGIGTRFQLAEPKFDGTIKAHKATAQEIIEWHKQKGETK